MTPSGLAVKYYWKNYRVVIHGNTKERHISFFIEYARFIAFSSLLFIHLTPALGLEPGDITFH